MKHRDLQQGKRKMMNRYMLDAMQIESRRWPKINDLDTSIKTNIILPQTILNYSEYQDKLQRLAFYAEQGDNEAMQKLLDKQEVISKKNSFLQPIYRDLKTTIKHMTYTSEFKLLREYTHNSNLILQSLPADSSKAQQGLDKLRSKYAALLHNQRLRLKQDDGAKLTVLLGRLEDMFKLLSLWQEYVDIIYAPEAEINMLKVLKDNGDLSGDTDVNFASKVESENMENKLKTLFAQGEDLEGQLKDMSNKIDEPYLTVNEGMTTDTSVTSDHEQDAVRQTIV
jgi:hypothetical protein